MDRTILIVDDGIVERTVLKGFLRDDYNVLEADGGESAIELLKKRYRDISVIIMDVVMPGMNGFETLSVIKANALWFQIPVIIATSLTDQKSLEKAVLLGADNFVTKPYNRALLLHVVRNVIRLRETASIASKLWRDPLTGLLNRESFFAEAERLIKGHEEGYYVLSCLDVENFKVVNDQYGTEKGDEVLKHIANSLNSFVASLNGLSCRYTADRFAILYPAVFKDSEKISDNHAELLSPRSINRAIRIRIGRCVVTDKSLAIGTLYDRATMAEETVKGRYDIYIAEYTEAMREELMHEQEVATEMVRALKNGEFEPWFQPQYNHATGALIGAEALVRWRRDGKIVPPAQFIPVFEKNGFIYEVDQYVWRQVCIILRRWVDEGKKPLPVSVNISRFDLFQKDFMSVITGLVTEYDLPVGLLRLEITESAFAESTKVVISAVNELIDLGFTVEIDDFGSGYSSLNTLKDVPASILKLDMKFFEATENTQRGGNIVESVVRMAKWLGMAVIAEGVEERAQADYLKSIGCYYIQGYYYDKPMPLEEYEARLETAEREPNMTHLETISTLDNNEFWNPKSMETLIFNSYVGGACIFEYSNGKSELLRANEQYTREMGGLVREGAQLKESSIVRFLDADSYSRLMDTVAEATENHREASCELRLVENAHMEYVMMTLREIARAGERQLFYCVIQNTTEKKMLADYVAGIEDTDENGGEALSEAQVMEYLPSLLAAIMESSSDIAFAKDKNFRYLCCNRALALHVGYRSEKDIIGKTDYDLFPAEQADKFRKNDIALVSAGRPIIDMVEAVPSFDGRLHYMRSSKHVLRSTTGETIGIYGVSVDITENRDAYAQLMLMTESIPTGLATFVCKDDSIHVSYCNNRFCELFGTSRDRIDEIIATNAMTYIFMEDKERFLRQYDMLMRKGTPIDCVYRVYIKTGGIRWVHHRAVVADRHNDVVYVNSAMFDITEQQEAQEKLRVSEEVNRIAIEHSGYIITRFDVHSRTLTLPEHFDPIFEVPHVLHNLPDGQIALGRVSPDTAGDYQKMFNDIFNGSTSGNCTYQQRSADGWRWLKARYTTVFSDLGEPVSAVITFTDVTEKLETKKRSERDPLTGVLNRTAFVDELEKVIRDSAPGEKHALLMLDVDDFKRVNDNYGHDVGDRILKELTTEIRASLRHDDLIGRLGGDEFFVLLKNVAGKEAAARKAEQICALDIRLNDMAASATLSMGVALIPEDGQSFDELYKKTDQALYKRKSGGKNGYIFVGE